MSTVSTAIPGAINGGSIGCNDQAAVTAGNTQVWSIPARLGSIGLQETITSDTGEYTVEATMNTLAAVQAGTAHWFDVFGANQTVSRQHSIMPSVTAVRITVVSGTVESAIRGQ